MRRTWAAVGVVLLAGLAGCADDDPDARPGDVPVDPTDAEAPPRATEPGANRTVAPTNNTLNAPTLPTGIVSFQWEDTRNTSWAARFTFYSPTLTTCTYDYEIDGRHDEGPVGARLEETEDGAGGGTNGGASSVHVAGNDVVSPTPSTTTGGSGGRPGTQGNVTITLMAHASDAGGEGQARMRWVYECEDPFDVVHAGTADLWALIGPQAMEGTASVTVTAVGNVLLDASTDVHVGDAGESMLWTGGAQSGSWTVSDGEQAHTRAVGPGDTFHRVFGAAGTWNVAFEGVVVYGSGVWAGIVGPWTDFFPTGDL